jgi:lipopolysaccharide/colanic/teichoic acid biosynthesis glycosyltransferase
MAMFEHPSGSGSAVVQTARSSTAQRLFDCVCATIGLFLLSPVFLVLGIAVKLYDGGPVLYRSQRIGRKGQLFSIYKFRTMVMDADRLGGGLTTKHDRRVTPPGRILRRYKFDELPQLLNVMKGDMSFVGARPEDPRYVARYTPEQKRILDYRPGITSPASLRFSNEEQLLTGENPEQLYLTTLLPQKLSMDLEYLAHRTLVSDLGIILRTIGRML